MFSTLILLTFLACGSNAQNATGVKHLRQMQATSGKLPGCRYIVRDTTRWVLPSAYYGTSGDTWKNGVCTTTKYSPLTGRFGIDESLWIRKDGESRIVCPDGITYCVASNYAIMKCGDIGCQKVTGGLNTCSTIITEKNCTYRNSEVKVIESINKLDVAWVTIMNGIETFLSKFAFGVGIDALNQLRGKKSIVIAAIRAAVGASRTMAPSSFMTIVKNAVSTAVPVASTITLAIGKGLGFPLLVWDIMNWDCFVVKAF